MEEEFSGLKPLVYSENNESSLTIEEKIMETPTCTLLCKGTPTQTTVMDGSQSKKKVWFVLVLTIPHQCIKG